MQRQHEADHPRARFGKAKVHNPSRTWTCRTPTKRSISGRSGKSWCSYTWRELQDLQMEALTEMSSVVGCDAGETGWNSMEFPIPRILWAVILSSTTESVNYNALATRKIQRHDSRKHLSRSKPVNFWPRERGFSWSIHITRHGTWRHVHAPQAAGPPRLFGYPAVGWAANLHQAVAETGWKTPRSPGTSAVWHEKTHSQHWFSQHKALRILGCPDCCSGWALKTDLLIQIVFSTHSDHHDHRINASGS